MMLLGRTGGREEEGSDTSQCSLGENVKQGKTVLKVRREGLYAALLIPLSGRSK